MKNKRKILIITVIILICLIGVFFVLTNITGSDDDNDPNNSISKNNLFMASTILCLNKFTFSDKTLITTIKWFI